VDIEPRFEIGQVVVHKTFGYRGVIIAVDPAFSGSAEWYERVARTKPRLDRPWYHVLVAGARHSSYVQEAKLTDDSEAPIWHPHLAAYFDEWRGDRYVRTRAS